MTELKQKISTYPQVKVALKEWAQDKEVFTTTDATMEIQERAGRVVVNNHKISQYLKALPDHEYHDGLKKWIKIRK